LKPGGELVVWGPNRFSVATDPHLGLWGVGWLPRRLVPGYLALRGRAEWPPRALGAAEARRLAARAGFESVTVGPPPVTEDWARTRPGAERTLIRASEAARAAAAGRWLLAAVGPLWELRARAGGAR
jgi:hypothetical protein